MSPPALPAMPEPRAISERANVLIAAHNLAHEPLTVAGLPSASSVAWGARAFVTDADTPVFGDVVVGGGSSSIPVYSDTVDWRCG